jgi:FlaG/FlaF family flagellin (archaellin)
MQKGISAVMAVVLIVMITVAVIGLAYAWATGLFRELAERAGIAVEVVPERMAKSIDIIAASCTNTTPTNNVVEFVIRHTGTLDISAGELAAMLDGALITTTPDITAAALTPGETAEFNYTVDEQKATRILSVSAPAATVDKSLSCPE